MTSQTISCVLAIHCIHAAVVPHIDWRQWSPHLLPLPSRSSIEQGEPHARQPHIDTPPVATVDVYVDDFLLMAQTLNQSQTVLRTTLVSIRLLMARDSPQCKVPLSVKKMLKGDAA